MSYSGTSDARVIERMIAENNEDVKLVYDAMGYQIAKEIGAAATVLQGDADAIILTGGLAYSERLTQYLESQVKYIAPVMILPGEGEIEALAAGCLRVLNGEEDFKQYN